MDLVCAQIKVSEINSAHAGFQVWSGKETTVEQINHARKELLNPGEGSHLYKATKKAWEWLKNGKLPEGNLFIFGHD